MANFIRVEVKAYPASVKTKPYADGYEQDTLAMADKPCYETTRDIFSFVAYTENVDRLYGALQAWLREEMLEQGKGIVLGVCPPPKKVDATP